MRRFAVPALVLVGVVGAARAQTLAQIRDQLRQAVREDRQTAFLAGMVDLSIEPEISGSQMRIDSNPVLHVSSLKVPFRRTIPLGADAPDLLVEGNLGLLRATADVDDLFFGALPGAEASVHSEWRAVSGLLGAGPQFDIGSGLHLAPLANVSLAYLDNHADYGGPGAAAAAAIADGILFRYHTTFATYGGALQLDRTWEFGAHRELEAIARVDARYSDTISATDSAQNAADWTQRGVVHTEYTAPTGWTLLGDRIDWGVHCGYTRFFGSNADVLGFVDFYELGATLHSALTSAIVAGTRIAITGAVQWGVDVTGFSLGLKFEF